MFIKTMLISLLFVVSSVVADTRVVSCPVDVTIVPTTTIELAKMGYAGGLASYSANGQRVIYYDIQLDATPEMKNHVIAHECAHHALGHVNRPSMMNYYAKERLEEHPADCFASNLLVKQLGYGEKEFKAIERVLTQKAGPARAQRVMGCLK